MTTPAATPPLNDLVGKIRSAHPGAYDDMDDATLTKRVLAKYPQYSDLAAPPVQPPKVDMQEDASVPTGYNTDAGGKLKGLPGVDPHTPTAGEAAGDVALAAGAYGAGSSILPAIAQKVAPYAKPMAGTYLINKARELPVVGPIIDKIPFAEALPWILGGKGAKGAEAAEAEGAGTAAESAPTVPPKTIQPEIESSPTSPAPSGTALPRTLSGESALNQILTGQDNVNLMKIAKSRGINVSQEAQLKPGFADNKLIRKIIDDFSPDELDNIRSTYAESTRNRHNFGDVGPEAWKTMSLKTYFPDLKISQAAEKRTAAAISGAKKPAVSAIDDDLTPILKQSLAAVKKK